MSKPNGQKPVQTLLSPRHDLNKKDKDKQRPLKRIQNYQKELYLMLRKVITAWILV